MMIANMTAEPITEPSDVPAPMQELVGLDRDELAAIMVAIGEPEGRSTLRAKQLWHWMYHHGARDFSLMTSLGGPLREKLAETCAVGRPGISREQISTDGTRKWLMRFDDNQEAESVYIPEDDRGAVCISSQVGCTLSCKFCHTGTQRLVRNLTPTEIVGQFMVARDSCGEWPSPSGERMLSNIVMMGMGEPLYNFDNVAKALRIIMDQEGIAISRRRITLSTAGVVPMMERCGAELGVSLAVSLHAADDLLRTKLVPVNKSIGIHAILSAADRYWETSGRRLTFEYVLLGNLNDSPDHARSLARFIGKRAALVNIIPYNTVDGLPWEEPTDVSRERFLDVLRNAGVNVQTRRRKGSRIDAACGQLRRLAREKPSLAEESEI